MAELTAGTARCRSHPDFPGCSRAGGIACSEPGHSGWWHTGGRSLLRGKGNPKLPKNCMGMGTSHVNNENIKIIHYTDCKSQGVICTVSYQLEPTGWQELPGCQAVAGTSCDFSSAILEYYDAHYVRVRAQAGPLVSPWSQVLEMVPEQVAQIGPPGLELQSTNGVVKVMVSPPEANQRKKMWINDLTFKYNLVFWENSSHAQECHKTPIISHKIPSNHTQKIPVGSSSINLYLNLQLLHKYCGQHLREEEGPLAFLGNKWLSVPGCENITSSWCNFSSIITGTGFYHLRVQAREGHNKSCFSREVKVDPLRTSKEMLS
uniref:Uncharacterized protein n=1 Tax=Junco hyemalis TaxID=40217 RepID=A0A8C5IV48_JUNHY